MTLKLYWAPRSRSFRILWLLEEIGVPYERVLVDFQKGEQSTVEYKAINPMMKVPALADGDARVAESGAICTYVADKFPETFGKFEMPSSQAGWGDAARVWSVLEDAVQPGPWLLGETFTAADVLIGSDLHFVVNQFKILEGRPAIDAYIARCAERPAYKRALELDEGGG